MGVLYISEVQRESKASERLDWKGAVNINILKTYKWTGSYVALFYSCTQRCSH